MAQGGVFSLVLRDERFDSLFTASDYLRMRMDTIRAERKKKGLRNIQPTFMDIEKTHMLYVRSDYRPYVAIASEYAKVIPTGDVTGIGAAGGTLQFALPTFGFWISDIVLHLQFGAIGNLAAFTASAAPTAATPYLRYCAFPGLRAIRRAEFKSAQVLIDDYTTEDAVVWSKFFVHKDQQVGWDRCHGQQEERSAAYFANGFTGTLVYRNGPQTPALAMPQLDLFIPIQFWMTFDPTRALLNDMIPNTQRQINIELAPLKDLIQALLPTPSPSPGVPVGLVTTPLPFASVPIVASLYVNGLFINPEIHDVFASRVNFSLIRVHRRQIDKIQSPFGSLLMSNLKFPAEYLMVTAKDRTVTNFDQWYLGGSTFAKPLTSSLFVPAYVWNSTLGIAELVVREAVPTSTLDPYMADFSVTAHAVTIFPKFPASWFNSYLPLRYMQDTAMVSPTDSSVYLIPFCLKPGQNPISGYLNLSSCRELYINYNISAAAAAVSAEFPANQYELHTTMSGLQILCIRGDALQLRFAI